MLLPQVCMVQELRLPVPPNDVRRMTLGLRIWQVRVRIT